MTSRLIFWLAVLLVFGGSAVCWTAWRLGTINQERVFVRSESDTVGDPKATGTDEPILKDFVLTERSGRSLGSDDLRGYVWVASFFFSSCPGSCRAQNLELLSLHNAYAKKGVKFVSITCDPRVDTPAKLREYADTLGAPSDSWYFLTGDLKYIRRVGAEIFRVWVDERGHMDRFMVVDRWGNVRGYFDWHDRARLEQMKHLLDELLVENEPPRQFAPVMAIPGAISHPAQKQGQTEQDQHDVDAADGEPAKDSGNSPADQADTRPATVE